MIVVFGKTKYELKRLQENVANELGMSRMD